MRGLSSASSTKRKDFNGCAPSEWLFFSASKSVGDCQQVMVSDIKCQVFNCGEVEGMSYDSRGTKPESDATGVYMRLTNPERTGICLC